MATRSSILGLAGLPSKRGPGLGSFSRADRQSLSYVRLFVTPWTAARQASLSIANSQSLLRLMSPGASETNLQIGPRLCISQLWRVPLLVTKHATNGKTSVPTLLELPAISWC